MGRYAPRARIIWSGRNPEPSREEAIFRQRRELCQANNCQTAPWIRFAQGAFAARFCARATIIFSDARNSCALTESNLYPIMIDQIQSTTLSNGLTILTEQMPGLRSVTVGIWVRRGSRHESPELNGICHFIEHAVFKGTKRRTALDIAIEIDRLGGHLDAYTTHEMTGFTMKVADTALPQAFDLLVGHARRARASTRRTLSASKASSSKR